MTKDELKKKIKESPLSRAELAERIGVAKSCIDHYCMGFRAIPSARARLICKVLDDAESDRHRGYKVVGCMLNSAELDSVTAAAAAEGMTLEQWMRLVLTMEAEKATGRGE